MQNPRVFGYIRVSTQEQNLDRQRIALQPFNIPDQNLYIDTQSGKDFNRPAYRRMLRHLKKDDLLIVKAIDRLGRNYQDITNQWRIITRDKQAHIRVLDMPLLDTTQYRDLLGTFISELVLQILSYTAQTERDLLRQRQTEGIAAAKARGTTCGRNSLILPENFPDVFHHWRDGKLTAVAAADLCGFSLRTFYNKVKLLLF
jgi:DNA invertase Pin-like site-specific DNA recombinase